jgi:hypothetical protein
MVQIRMLTILKAMVYLQGVINKEMVAGGHVGQPPWALQPAILISASEGGGTKRRAERAAT